VKTSILYAEYLVRKSFPVLITRLVLLYVVLITHVHVVLLISGVDEHKPGAIVGDLPNLDCMVSVCCQSQLDD
jgi:hypothetical protein